MCLIELLGLFNRSGAIRALALDISKVFDRVWHTGLFHKLRSCGTSGQIFGLISFLSNRRLWIVLEERSSQEYPGNARVPQRSILGPTLYLLCINYFPDVICNIAIYAVILLSILNIIRHLIRGNN